MVFQTVAFLLSVCRFKTAAAPYKIKMAKSLKAF